MLESDQSIPCRDGGIDDLFIEQLGTRGDKTACDGVISQRTILPKTRSNDQIASIASSPITGGNDSPEKGNGQ